MNVSTEGLLASLIVALYLKDCALLLGVNEAVLTSRRGKRWSAGFGARTWRIAGREPFVANPFLPDQAVFRLRWRMTPDAGKAAAGATPVQVPAQLVRVGYLAWLMWLELFVVLPMCLLARLGPRATILTIGCLYLSIVASLALVWIWRRPLGVEARAFSLLAFECIACPPYAANLVRKLTALRRADEDFEVAAQRLLDVRGLEQVKSECLARLDEQMESN